MNDFLVSPISGWIGIALFLVGILAAVYSGLALPGSPLRAAWIRYIAYLDGYVSFLFLPLSGAQIAARHLFGVCLTLILVVWQPSLLSFAAVAVVVVIPPLYLDKLKADRVVKLEDQLDGWLMNLSNALKATPAIGEAIRSTADLAQPPMSEELDLMVKQNQLGTPVDQTVLNASERMGSPIIGGALATIVIARQTGGDLPTILETSASSLREMNRLEGVVRTKTAEGKGQVVVMGILPFALMGILLLMDEHWFDPMFGSFVGNLMIGFAFLLWGAALAWARKILAVDI